MADALNEGLLPEGYFAEEHIHLGPRVEIDVSTFAEPAPALPREQTTLPAAFPDCYDVLIFESEGAKLVAAIELVSPANKDRGAHRRAFAVKCASYLCRGISLIIIDIVTSRQANLHNEMMHVLGHEPAANLPAEVTLYAVAYRPIVRDQAEQVDVWPVPLAVGGALPVLPLALNAELCLPLGLEATYGTACQRRRLP
jgi:hypothetical protein